MNLPRESYRSRSQAGMSLIETVIALGILLVVAAGIMTVATVSITTTENQGNRIDHRWHRRPRSCYTGCGQQRLDGLPGRKRESHGAGRRRSHAGRLVLHSCLADFAILSQCQTDHGDMQGFIGRGERHRKLTVAVHRHYSKNESVLSRRYVLFRNC